MNWQILDGEEFEEWHEVLQHFPRGDVYFLPEYHRAYELNGDGQVRAFIANSGDNYLFHPFFIRAIRRVGNRYLDKEWFDIETVYGYSGPLATRLDSMFLHEAWSEFCGWCHEQRVVAEFIRFDPLLENFRYMDDSCETCFDRETVVIDLDRSEEELWASYPSRNRNMVRKAQAKGMICEQVSLVEGLSKFRRLYNATMLRNQADEYYFLSDAYFAYLQERGHEFVKLFTVRDQEHVVAASLFLTYGPFIHYHLSGNEAEYIKFGPNNLLIHSVASWALQRGFSKFHLGGGRTSSPDDGLLRFKSSFSKGRLRFHIGKRVHNQEMYEKLCALWKGQCKSSKHPSHFLLYRLELN